MIYSEFGWVADWCGQVVHNEEVFPTLTDRISGSFPEIDYAIKHWCIV